MVRGGRWAKEPPTWAAAATHRAQEEMQFGGEAIGEGKLGFGLEALSFRVSRTSR